MNARIIAIALAIGVSALVLSGADPLPATKPVTAPATGPAATTTSAPAGWTAAYTLDLSKAGKLGANWQVSGGAKAEIANGVLVLQPATDPGNECILTLTDPAFPRSVRMEFEVALEGNAPSDISSFLYGDQTGFPNGYLFQFGGQSNTVTRLLRAGKAIDATASNLSIKPGQKYKIIAQNDEGKVSLTIDGKEAFSFADTAPLGGEDGMVGLYTWNSTLKISSLVVYNKPKELAATTQPVDEKAVNELIRQLGDDNYKVREAATAKLIAMGKAARPILQAKAQEKDLDLETANRIQLILKQGRK